MSHPLVAATISELLHAMLEPKLVGLSKQSEGFLPQLTENAFGKLYKRKIKL